MSAPHTHTHTAPASPTLEYSHDHLEAENCEPLDGKKRKYEEATSVEKYELYLYHQQNPKLKQRELAEWFSNRFNRQINQSTVSRNLKKFKVQPPSPPGAVHEVAPRKRERKPQPTPAPSQTHQPIHHSSHHRSHSSTSSNGLGPATPPPRDVRRSLDRELYDFFIQVRRDHHATEEYIHQQLKHCARKIISSWPHQEQFRIDDAWINEWKRSHGIPPPSPASFTGHASPRAHSTLGADLAHRHGGSSRSTSSEPRSPMSAVSSISSSHRREELPPVSELFAASDGHRYVSKSGSPNPAMYDREARRREMSKLRHEIERRNERIEVEIAKRDIAINRLRDLEKLDREESTGPRLAPIHA